MDKILRQSLKFWEVGQYSKVNVKITIQCKVFKQVKILRRRSILWDKMPIITRQTFRIRSQIFKKKKSKFEIKPQVLRGQWNFWVKSSNVKVEFFTFYLWVSIFLLDTVKKYVNEARFSFYYKQKQSVSTKCMGNGATLSSLTIFGYFLQYLQEVWGSSLGF